MVVAVLGSSSVPSDSPDYQDAVRLGEALARAGFTIATGGYGGIMEAVSEGARKAGGDVIGVTAPSVFPERPGPNRYVTRETAVVTLTERFHHLIELADGRIALTPSLGTLVEVLVAWNVCLLARRRGQDPGPIVAVGERWKDLLGAIADPVGAHDPPISYVESVDEAVAVISRELR